MIYAGIGSRETPANILTRMWELGYELAERGWILRSGHAGGADMAFEMGCIAASGTKEIYLPWSGFNGAPEAPDYISGTNSDHLAIAANFHPAWSRCSAAAKRLHGRNVCQILGSDLNTKADMVICWTKNGLAGGGTGQAIRIARAYGVPVFDLALPAAWQDMVKHVQNIGG